MLFEQKLDIKFRFVEDFPTDEEVDYAAQLREEPEEPKKTKTKFFGDVELHQIARVEWREIKVEVEREKYGAKGKVSYETEEVVMYQMMKGELGGWLESLGNLSQEGKCWVYQNGYVMGGAYVYGDAEVKGGAEVGDSARVGDRVVLDGSFGIGGTAKLLDDAKVNGARRMAVFGSAEVRGKSRIEGQAKVYGHSKVGDCTAGAILSGYSRAYGHSIVKGVVLGRAEVYGRAEVLGRVAGDCMVGGTAFIGSAGSVDGEVTVERGSVNGSLSGDGAAVFPQFSLRRYSSLVLKKEADAVRDREEESDDEKDGKEDRPPLEYSGDVKSLKIGSWCYVDGCTFKGSVTIDNATLENCDIEDSFIGTKEDSGHALSGNQRVYASECTFEGCRIPAGEFDGSSLRRCYIPSDKSQGTRVVSSKLEDTVILNYCRVVQSSALDEVTANSNYISNEKFDDCAVMESGGPHGVTWNLVGMVGLGGEEFRTLVRPNEYRSILGSGNGIDHNGVKELDGISFYVYKYDGYHKYLMDAVDYAEKGTLDSERNALWEARRLIEKKRSDWFWGVVAELDGRVKSAPYNERFVLSQMASFVRGFSGLDWFYMSDESFNRISAAIAKTIASYDGERFVPCVDFGQITMDPSFAELEEKYRVASRLY